MTNLVVIPKQGLEALVDRTMAGLVNKNTRAAYRTQFRRFLKSGAPLTRAGVMDFLAAIDQPSVRFQASMAVRKLAHEGRIAGYITHDQERDIRDYVVGSAPQTRMGHWLSLEGVQRLISLPNRRILIGARDLAMFALVLGCGLRRAEAVAVTWEQYSFVEGRALLVDIVGKREKIRTVPVPKWAMDALDHWRDMLTLRLNPLGIEVEGPILRQAMPKREPTEPLGAHAIGTIVAMYAKMLDFRFSPHDLRRTLAQLMRKAGAPIEQIQFTLGHSGVQTTERYLGGGIEIGVGKAAVDLINWEGK